MPYEPMPIIARNLKESDVHQLETKLDAFLAYDNCCTWILWSLDLLINILPSALESHPEMKIPASSSPKALFFTYDFAQTTRNKLLAIPIPALEAGDEKALESYSDCLGRCMMSKQIICDESGMMCTMMTGGQAPVDFGKNAREKAKAF